MKVGRRSFLGFLATGAAGLLLPRKTFFLPPQRGWRPRQPAIEAGGILRIYAGTYSFGDGGALLAEIDLSDPGFGDVIATGVAERASLDLPGGESIEMAIGPEGLRLNTRYLLAGSSMIVDRFKFTLE